jgi:hypothetical protein
LAEASAAPPPLLVFVHIPKTAGTTLRTILSMNEPGDRTRALGNVFKGAGGVDRKLMGRLAEDRRAIDLAGVRILRGHFPLGIRDLLPADREIRYFTLLRDPVERTLSHYFQIRESDAGRNLAVGAKQESLGLVALPEDPSIDDTIKAGYIQDNLQTRMLSGAREPFGDVTEEMLEQAKENLRERIAVFGLTERFDDFLALAGRRLGFRSILYHQNGRVNLTRPRGRDVPAEFRRAAEESNRYDIELYRYASELFDSSPEFTELDIRVTTAALRAAKVEGEIDLDIPPPEGHQGGEEEWRMLLEARARVLRLEWELARDHIPRVAATVQDEALEGKLKVARTRARELEDEIRRLERDHTQTRRDEIKRLESERSRSKALAQEVKRLEAARAQAKELDEAMQRLEAARARTKELQGAVARLKSDGTRPLDLRERAKRLAAARAKTKDLERQVRQLKVARRPARVNAEPPKRVREKR